MRPKVSSVLLYDTPFRRYCETGNAESAKINFTTNSPTSFGDTDTENERHVRCLLMKEIYVYPDLKLTDDPKNVSI
jgi:hypothetical protein